MRSGREHCGSRVAVEQGRRGRRGGRGGGGEEEEEQEEEQEEEEATDIKSNNPHLAGGEKYLTCYVMGFVLTKRCDMLRHGVGVDIERCDILRCGNCVDIERCDMLRHGDCIDIKMM